MSDKPIQNYNQQDASGDYVKTGKQSGLHDAKIPTSEAKHNLNDQGLPIKGLSPDAERKAANKSHHGSRT